MFDQRVHRQSPPKSLIRSQRANAFGLIESPVGRNFGGAETLRPKVFARVNRPINRFVRMTEIAGVRHVNRPDDDIELEIHSVKKSGELNNQLAAFRLARLL